MGPVCRGCYRAPVVVGRIGRLDPRRQRDGIGDNESEGKAPQSLPTFADSAQVKDILEEFPDADVAPAVLVVERIDGAPLTPADQQAVAAAQERMLAVQRSVPADTPAGPPVITSPDGKAAISIVPVNTDLSGFELADLVVDPQCRRRRAACRPQDLRHRRPRIRRRHRQCVLGRRHTTSLAVTRAGGRDPAHRDVPVTLWLIPLLVIAFADRVANSIGIWLADLTDLSFDGSTAGITSVLVFGAGTNYALLLISRYREELRAFSLTIGLHSGMRCVTPARRSWHPTPPSSWPCSTLLFAVLPSTRSLGALAAAGLVVAVLFALLVLPPLLALFGTRVFWPFVPKVGDPVPTEGGVWFRIAGGVSRHPVRVLGISLTVLIACALGLAGADIGLSQTEQFRVSSDSVDGYDVLAEHFPPGQADPTTVVAKTATAEQVQVAIDNTDGVVSGTENGQSDTGWTQWSVVIDAAPGSQQAFDIIEDLRSATADVPDSDALVGGSDAEALDTQNAATTDRFVIIPLILAVVFVILIVFLRALVAPVVLVATTVLSTLAAIGVGSLISEHIFGFPALDDNVPLYAFLFLVALGIDYTMFLVIRAREETPGHGTRNAIVRAVASTGAVITSAGIVLAAVFCVLASFR